MNANFKKIHYLEESFIQDNQTGEVIEKKTNRTVNIPKEEDYVKIYIKHINYLNNLPNGLDSIIYALLKRINYQNQIVINSAIKRQIAEELNKKFNTINQSITKLVKYNILIRIDTGIYLLNPIFYGKGSWREILDLREKLEINVSYQEDEYTITHKYQ
jgi:hypothetical protein